ncbi:hypothetical protein Ga0609869_003555 [Rhodovulum iodosum]|uniref:Uncharacterized protein n=1 Tax=Rhodovulum iodosum TaxID=68291 RepID=A0ABV3XXV1_9RHOB|nr:hypothetical protein [Rhodovulum robiginosum]RSK38175.1 hypothetical protein EJA01_02520 [Rhodovulum robiginosum]
MRFLPLRALLAAAVLCGTVVVGAPAAQSQDIEFGPGLRSVDFADVFDSSVKARARMWHAFYRAGIRTIVVSQGLISPYAPDHSRRPSRTYLSDGQLKDLRDTLNRGPSTKDDFHLTYVAGYGLGAKACRQGSTPSEIATAAAEWEFENIVSRVLDSGVPIRAIDVDGPFLRVMEGSRKAFSCALSPATKGVSSAASARIALSYMKRLRDLTDAHVTNSSAGVKVEMALLINLPNWRVGGYPALRTAGATGDLVTDVLAEFGKAMRADKTRPLHLSGAVIDYPYPLARSRPAAFKAKSERLLAGLRALPRTTAKLTFIANTHYALDPYETEKNARGYAGTVRCVWSDYRDISEGSLPYLPYENARGTKMPADCMAAQNAADERYWDESARFADEIMSGAWLGNSVDLKDVSAVRFMSWHEMPASSLSTMNRTLRYKLYGN